MRPLKLKRIGYWESGEGGPWPSVSDFVDTSICSSDRERLIIFLRSGFLAWAQLGFSDCRVCGARNGSADLTDGTFIWPEGLAHYVERHDVWLPAEFTDHAFAVQDRLEVADVDLTWWSEIGRAD